MEPIAALLFTVAGILLVISMTFWLVDPNRKP
jgi:hypothetical protein